MEACYHLSNGSWPLFATYIEMCSHWDLSSEKDRVCAESLILEKASNIYKLISRPGIIMKIKCGKNGKKSEIFHKQRQVLDCWMKYLYGC